MPRRLMASLLIAAALMAACRDEGRPESTFPQLPDEPPDITGVVYGVGRPDDYYDPQPPYEFHQYGRARRVDLPTRVLSTFAVDAEMLAVSNGRVLAVCCVSSGGDHASPLDEPTRSFLGDRHHGLAELEGGRFAVLENANPHSGLIDYVLRIRDDNGLELASLDIENAAVTPPAPTPDGGFALVVQRPGGDAPADRASLVMFSATGIPVHEANLGDLRSTAGFNSTLLAVSRSGLAAVFAGDHHDSFLQRETVVVANASTGERIRGFKGWGGGAWSPDGTGLLLARPARRTAPRSTELAIAYGPKLAKLEKLGIVEGEFVPMRWLPEALPGA